MVGIVERAYRPNVDDGLAATARPVAVRHRAHRLFDVPEPKIRIQGLFLGSTSRQVDSIEPDIV